MIEITDKDKPKGRKNSVISNINIPLTKPIYHSRKGRPKIVHVEDEIYERHI